MKKAFLAMGIAALVSHGVFADAGNSSRMDKRAGVYLGILGDPFPTLIGVNLAYNVFDFMRATAGFGQVSATLGTASSSATTFGAGGRFFVPGWDISPVAGLSAAYVSVSTTGSGVITVGGFNASQFHIYANIGVDWQSKGGFNLGAGYNLSFMGAGGAPYLNIGWYTDFI